MNVLIYTGYQTEPYSPNTLKHKGLGGTEQCCIYLSRYLKNFGWNVVVGGNVDEVTVNGVRWMKTETIHKEMFDQFDFEGRIVMELRFEDEEWKVKRECK